MGIGLGLGLIGGEGTEDIDLVLWEGKVQGQGGGVGGGRSQGELGRHREGWWGWRCEGRSGCRMKTQKGWGRHGRESIVHHCGRHEAERGKCAELKVKWQVY
jgi:hypothetical protein